MESTKNFAATLRAVLERDEISNRELTRRCRDRGWGSLGTINRLVNDELRPTQVSMEAVATALKIRPETFAEYRLLRARQKIDPDEVALRTALKNLDRYEGRDAADRDHDLEEKSAAALRQGRRGAGLRRGGGKAAGS